MFGALMCMCAVLGQGAGGASPPVAQRHVVGVRVEDPDIGDNEARMILFVDRGLLTLQSVEGLTFQMGDGLNDVRMEFLGTLAAINAAINDITYTMLAGDSGTCTLTININDQGFTGLGGPLEDQVEIPIPLPVVNRPPRIIVPADAVR